MQNKNYFSILILIIFLFSLVFLLIHNKSSNNFQYIKIAGVLLKIEVASTAEALARGLSGRSELKENEGMLFVFDQPGEYSFWMKDMNFPIDIIWLREDGEVIYIKKDARPESYPESFGSGKYAKYVLEVAALFSEKNNLKIGDIVLFTF